MTDITWGEPIAVNGVRPEWLRHGQVFQWSSLMHPDYKWWEGLSVKATSDGDGFNPRAWHSLDTIRLPANHPYYLATSRGFTYWPGGDAAPADWDGGEVLMMKDAPAITRYVRHLSWGAKQSWPIIGYRRRAEPADTVTIAPMTLSAWDRRYEGRLGDWAQYILSDLGLIKPDPSPAERIAAKLADDGLFVEIATVESVLSARDAL